MRHVGPVIDAGDVGPPAGAGHYTGWYEFQAVEELQQYAAGPAAAFTATVAAIKARVSWRSQGNGMPIQVRTMSSSAVRSHWGL